MAAEHKTPAGNQSALLPLAGLVVLDFSQFLAGPSCALRLADLGADVIKVERPQGGDACRQLRLADQTFDDASMLFHTINRNKRSFAANLKNPEDLERVKKLIDYADVLIHNFRPGVMERLGLGFENLCERHPRLVYAAVSGYGSNGPWRDKPGQDLLVQALSGMTWLSGDAAQGPVPFGLSLTDLATGANLCQGILALLVRRAVTGKGGRVDVSLIESALDLQFEQFTAFLNGPRTQPARSAVNNANLYVGAPYGIYATADGHMALAMIPIVELGRLIGCKALAAYEELDCFRERDTIKTILADHLKTETTAHWLTILEAHDVWATRVLDWPSLVSEGGYEALEPTQDVHAQAGSFVTTRCPIRIDGGLLSSDRAASRLGADTETIAKAFGLPSKRAPS